MTDRQQQPAKRRLLRVILAGALLMICIAAALLVALTPPPAEIPTVALPNMHPSVAELLERQRARVAADPTSADAWGIYGMCLHQHDRLNEALICYDHAAQLQPQAAKWHYYAGVILQQTDSQKAMSLFETVLKQNPDYTPAALRLAELLIASGDAVKSKRVLDGVNGTAPTQAKTSLLQLRLILQTGDFDAVDALLSKARDAQCTTRELLAEAARVEMLRGNMAIAESMIQESGELPSIRELEQDPWMNDVLQFDTTGAVMSMQADLLRQSGQMQEAANLFARLARRFPDRSRPGLNHAMMLAESGNAVQAIRELSELHERFPDDPLICFNLAFAEFQAGRIVQAEQHLRSAIERKSDYGAAWAALADICVQTNRPEEALEAFRSAVAAVPEQGDIQLAFADFLIRNGRRDEAKVILNTAHSFLQKNPQWQQEWSRLHDELNQAEPPG